MAGCDCRGKLKKMGAGAGGRPLKRWRKWHPTASKAGPLVKKVKAKGPLL